MNTKGWGQWGPPQGLPPVDGIASAMFYWMHKATHSSQREGVIPGREFQEAMITGRGRGRGWAAGSGAAI